MACKCELRRKIREAAVPWVPERTVYMDYNATTPVDPRVIGAFERACRRTWGNPSSLHSAGSAGWNELEQLNSAASDFFGVNADGFELCNSGTDAIATILFGLCSRKNDLNIITTAVEHQAVRHPLFHLARKTPLAPRGYAGSVLTLPVDYNGMLSVPLLEKTFSRTFPGPGSTALILSPVNHETGSIQPVKEIAAAARKFGALVILDSVQAAARLQPSEWAPFCDIFCISGHKLYAPKGTALIWSRPGIRLSTIRRGTENVPGAAALCEALKLMKLQQQDEIKMLEALCRDGVSILEKTGLGFTIETPEKSAPGILCISFKSDVDMEELLFMLNRMNICISRFSACSERLSGQSAVLRAMGRPAKRASGSIRISLGRFSRRDDFYKLASALKTIIN